MNDLLLALTQFSLDAILVTIRYFILMFQLCIGLSIILFILGVLAAIITIPVEVVKSIFTTKNQ